MTPAAHSLPAHDPSTPSRRTGPDRRSVLRAGAAAGAVAGAGALIGGAAPAGAAAGGPEGGGPADGVFRHGVASGDPMADA